MVLTTDNDSWYYQLPVIADTNYWQWLLLLRSDSDSWYQQVTVKAGIKNCQW